MEQLEQLVLLELVQQGLQEQPEPQAHKAPQARKEQRGLLARLEQPDYKGQLALMGRQAQQASVQQEPQEQKVRLEQPESAQLEQQAHREAQERLDWARRAQLVIKAKLEPLEQPERLVQRELNLQLLLELP